MPSLALLFELADRASFEGFVVGENPKFISLEHTKQSAAWCEYLHSHAKRTYSWVSTPEMQPAYDMAQKIKAEKLGREKFTVRDVYFKEWAGLQTPDSVRESLSILEDGNLPQSRLWVLTF
jgi:hypothetical protein